MTYPGVCLLCSRYTDALKLSALCRASEKQPTTQSLGDVGWYISVPLQLTGIKFVDPMLPLLPTPCWGAAAFPNTSSVGWRPGSPKGWYVFLGEESYADLYTQLIRQTKSSLSRLLINTCLYTYISKIGIRWTQVGDSPGLDPNRGFTCT